MPSPNPLLRTHPLVHLPLLVLALLFAVPLAWLLTTSLQPREQVGKIPPEWLPRQRFIQVGSERISVTPAQTVGSDKLLVKIESGPHAGRALLVAPGDYDGERATVRVQAADRVELQRHAARLVQRVPGHFVVVHEWFLSKTRPEPRVFYVAPEAVRSELRPLWENYPEAIRALTAVEKDKALPLGQLISKSSLPWLPKRQSGGRTVTFLTYLSNTLVVAVLGVVGTVFSSALVAYGLSRLRWPGRESLFKLTLATMMIPFPVLMIPLYAVFRELGWIGTLLPLWVPAFFGNAFNIFLLRQFFLTIPSELSDAARIDGCSEFSIFWRIMLPLARPALSVVALFHFLFVWNDFLGPLIYLTEPETFTMALGLQQYQSQNGGSEWHLLMAASVLLILPIVMLFFFAQRTFIQGISTTGMGGR